VNISSCSFFSTPSLAAFSISCGGVKKKKEGERFACFLCTLFLGFLFGLVLCVSGLARGKPVFLFFNLELVRWMLFRFCVFFYQRTGHISTPLSQSLLWFWFFFGAFELCYCSFFILIAKKHGVSFLLFLIFVGMNWFFVFVFVFVFFWFLRVRVLEIRVLFYTNYGGHMCFFLLFFFLGFVGEEMVVVYMYVCMYMKADFGLPARRNLDYEELHVIHRKKARKGMKEV
jgi:hypothetical protein